MAASNARSRDPRLLKMRNQIGNANMQGHSIKMEQQSSSVPAVPSVRGLPRIPKYNKSSHDPRKRRDKEGDDKSNSSGHRSNKSSSSKSSPSKKSSHESTRKRDDEKKSSKSSHKSSRSHSSSSKSPTKSPDDTLKDIDLRAIVGDIDMRPDSTTIAAAAVAESKINKNKLLNDLLHDEDMRSSQDSMISTSNGKNLKEIKIFSMKLSRILVS